MGLIGRGQGWIAMPDNTDARWLASEAEAREYRELGWYVDGPVVAVDQLRWTEEQTETQP